MAMPAQPTMSAVECAAMWRNADANSDGQLYENEAELYVRVMKHAKLSPRDPTGKSLTFDEFMKACEGGTFDSMSM
jgi:hypothetical protein